MVPAACAPDSKYSFLILQLDGTRTNWKTEPIDAAGVLAVVGMIPSLTLQSAGPPSPAACATIGDASRAMMLFDLIGTTAIVALLAYSAGTLRRDVRGCRQVGALGLQQPRRLEPRRARAHHRINLIGQP